MDFVRTSISMSKKGAHVRMAKVCYSEMCQLTLLIQITLILVPCSYFPVNIDYSLDYNLLYYF